MVHYLDISKQLLISVIQTFYIFITSFYRYFIIIFDHPFDGIQVKMFLSLRAVLEILRYFIFHVTGPGRGAYV